MHTCRLFLSIFCGMRETNLVFLNRKCIKIEKKLLSDQEQTVVARKWLLTVKRDWFRQNSVHKIKPLAL